jgi:uncharacterized protein
MAEDLAPKTRSTISTELFCIPLDPSRYLIYAPLRRAAFVANAATVNKIADIKNDLGNTTSEQNKALLQLLEEIEIINSGPDPSPVTEFQGIPEPTSVTLFMTTACNLRCTYCYANAGETPLKSMPLDVAQRGIDFVIGNAVRRGLPQVEVAFHGGGEPTVNWQVLTGAVLYARTQGKEHGVTVHAGLATNGVLPDIKIDWIVSHMDDASVSFDGLPSLHDRHRPMASGQGSSARVLHTLRRFDEAGFPYGLRMTVTADQISALPESVEFVCANLKVTSIQVEPSYQLGRWADAPSAETEEFLAAYREAKARARELGRDISFSGARVGLLSNHFCGVTQDAFSLSPNGNVSACYEVFSEDRPFADRFFYGRPEREGYAFNLAVLEQLRGQSVQNRRHCQGCFAKWSCGGDCYHKALHGSLEDTFAGTERCHIIRELTKDQILDQIQAAGGWFWHGGA